LITIVNSIVWGESVIIQLITIVNSIVWGESVPCRNAVKQKENSMRELTQEEIEVVTGGNPIVVDF